MPKESYPGVSDDSFPNGDSPKSFDGRSDFGDKVWERDHLCLTIFPMIENGGAVVEYDKEGHVLIKRVSNGELLFFTDRRHLAEMEHYYRTHPPQLY